MTTGKLFRKYLFNSVKCVSTSYIFSFYIGGGGDIEEVGMEEVVLFRQWG